MLGSPATGLFYAFDDVVAKLGFDWTADLAFLKFKGAFFKFFDHFASAEGS